MADGQKKLFDREDLLGNDSNYENSSAIGMGGAPQGLQNDEERLSELYYAEKYRQRIRRGRNARPMDDLTDRLARIHEEEAETARQASESEAVETKAHNDRIAELLSRIDKMTAQKEALKEIDDGAVASEPRETPTERIIHAQNASFQYEPKTYSEYSSNGGGRGRLNNVIDSDSGVISMKGSVYSEFLHIDGVTYQNGESRESGNAEDFAGISRDGGAFVPLTKKISNESNRAASSFDDRETRARKEERGAGSDVEYRGVRRTAKNLNSTPRAYRDPEARTYTDPEIRSYRDPEARTYTDPEIRSYRDPEARTYTDPEARNYSDAERRLYSDPEHITYTDVEGRLYQDPEMRTYHEPERGLYRDPEADTYLDPEKTVYPDPEYFSAIQRSAKSQYGASYERGRDVSSPYPEMDAYGYAETRGTGYINIESPYPEAGDRFITRKNAKEMKYIPEDAYGDGEDIRTYGDPEANSYDDPELGTDPYYPDPPIRGEDKKRSLSARERKALKREQERAILDDAIRFERESRDGNFRPYVNADDPYSKYEDLPGREYPDPEANIVPDPGYYSEEELKDRDIEKSLFGDGSTPFDPRVFRKFMKRAVALDLKRIKEQFKERKRELKLELKGSLMRFSKNVGKKNDAPRTETEIRSDIASLASDMKFEKHRARVIGKICMSVLVTDFTRCKIKRKANRGALVTLRNDLIQLLTERYHLEKRMIDIFTCADSKENLDGRCAAELRGKRRAFKNLKRIERKIEVARIGVGFKKKIYPLMDEYVELSGQLERVIFSLKRERPKGVLKRELKKQKKKLKKRIARVFSRINYFKKRGLRKAENRRAARRSAIAGWIVLVILLGAGLLIYLYHAEILAYILASFGAG